MWFNSQIRTQLHLAEQGPVHLPAPQQDAVLAKSCQVAGRAMSSHYTCSHPAGLTHPGHAPTNNCQAKPGAKATLGTTPAG